MGMIPIVPQFISSAVFTVNSVWEESQVPDWETYSFCGVLPLLESSNVLESFSCFPAQLTRCFLPSGLSVPLPEGYLAQLHGNYFRHHAPESAGERARGAFRNL